MHLGVFAQSCGAMICVAFCDCWKNRDFRNRSRTQVCLDEVFLLSKLTGPTWSETFCPDQLCPAACLQQSHDGSVRARADAQENVRVCDYEREHDREYGDAGVPHPNVQHVPCFPSQSCLSSPSSWAG